MLVRVVFFVICLTLVSSEHSKVKPSLDVKASLNEKIVADVTEDNANNNEIIEKEVGDDDIDVNTDLMEHDTLADEEEDMNEDVTADVHDAKPFFWLFRRRRWGKKDSTNNMKDAKPFWFFRRRRWGKKDSTNNMKDAKPWRYRRRRHNA